MYSSSFQVLQPCKYLVLSGNIIAFEAVFYKFNSRIEDSLCRLHSR